MVATNFVIDSDYKWLLFGMALLWAAGLASFWLEAASQRRSHP